MERSPSSDDPPQDRLEEAREILRTLRRCRSRLNQLNLDHAAAYADIAVQLLKQSIAIEEAGSGSEHETAEPETSLGTHSTGQRG
jgi:hypothetical protein